MKRCGSCLHSRIRSLNKLQSSIAQEQRLNCTLFPPVPMLVPNERKGIETAFGFPVVLASMVCGQWLPQPGFDDNGDEEKPQAASSFVI